jgi:hypothetical protein
MKTTPYLNLATLLSEAALTRWIVAYATARLIRATGTLSPAERRSVTICRPG